MKSSKRYQQARQRVSTLVVAFRAIPHSRYVLVLAALLGLVVLRSAVGAHVMGTWLLENAPVALGVLFLWATYRLMPLSRVSYTLIFLFFCLHETGAHWTYAKVPYDEWTRSL